MAEAGSGFGASIKPLGGLPVWMRSRGRPQALGCTRPRAPGDGEPGDAP